LKVKNLTEGPITSQIIRLTVPILGTSFVQMAYNLTDMLWLGRVGSDAVAAVGIASYFTWLGVSLMLVGRIGAEVGVSQSLGAKDKVKAESFAVNAVSLVVVLSLLYGIFTYIFAPELVSFFHVQNKSVEASAISYMRIISIGSLLYYSNPTFTGIINGTGNSKLPFRINAIGLIANVVLNPILIFGFGPIPRLGSNGSAIATVISQTIVLMVFIFMIGSGKSALGKIRMRLEISAEYFKKIIKLGSPVALHSILFASFGMALARIIAPWGAMPIAVQSIGAQIEALSWMTAGGFSTALGIFTGQNFGANRWDRIFKGYFTTITISGTIGILVTISFLVFGREIYTLFLREEEAISLGVRYLSILAISQFFMCVEITTGGIFNGVGKTVPPSLVGITVTGLRIPLALYLSQPSIFGVTGVWWSITLTSVMKGLVLFGWFYFWMKGHPQYTVTNRRKIDFIRLLPTRLRQDVIDSKTEEEDES
jgi:putative MATE family efflux protein